MTCEEETRMEIQRKTETNDEVTKKSKQRRAKKSKNEQSETIKIEE